MGASARTAEAGPKDEGREPRVYLVQSPWKIGRGLLAARPAGAEKQESQPIKVDSRNLVDQILRISNLSFIEGLLQLRSFMETQSFSSNVNIESAGLPK